MCNFGEMNILDSIIYLSLFFLLILFYFFRNAFYLIDIILKEPNISTELIFCYLCQSSLFVQLNFKRAPFSPLNFCSLSLFLSFCISRNDFKTALNYFLSLFFPTFSLLVQNSFERENYFFSLNSFSFPLFYSSLCSKYL